MRLETLDVIGLLHSPSEESYAHPADATRMFRVSWNFGGGPVSIGLR